MPPPPPTSLIAGGNENGFAAPKPTRNGIIMLFLLCFTAFHFFYWYVAPAVLLLIISHFYTAYTEGRKKQSGTDREPLAKEEARDETRCHVRHHPFLLRAYYMISSHVVGSWFEIVSAMLEGWMGINYTYIVVASKPATEESTAALAASNSAAAEVSTAFLTQRGEAAKSGDKKSTLLTEGNPSDDAMRGFADGVSPKAQKAFNLTRPVTAIDVFKPPLRGKINIVLLNHRCRLDWMMLWPLLIRALGSGITNAQSTHVNTLAALKIIMKQDMAYIPWLGYCTQAARCLFLKRRWDEDQQNVTQYMRYLASDAEEQTLLLIFPEGTDFCPSAIERSKKWAMENNRPQYSHVLHPRTTGLLAMKNAIGSERIDRIIDITIAYADRRKGDRTNDVHLLGDMMPPEISFITESFVFEDNKEAPTEPSFDGVPAPVRVPADDAGFRDWVEARWATKESDMAKYYSSAKASSANDKSYGWDCERDIEAEQWADGKGNKYDRFVIGGTMETSIYNRPTRVAGLEHPNGGTIGTYACFFKNQILAGGIFNGQGKTSSIFTYLLKPIINFAPCGYFFHIYLPFRAASWWPMILALGWIVAATAFFVVYIQKMRKSTFDREFLFSSLEVPQAVLDAERAREEGSTLKTESAAPTAAAKTETTA